MRVLIFICILVVYAACSTPNNAASTRTSTAPMSNNPTTTLPGTGAKPPFNNRMEQTTGTSPSTDALPDSTSSSAAGTDSTAHR